MVDRASTVHCPGKSLMMFLLSGCVAFLCYTLLAVAGLPKVGMAVVALIGLTSGALQAWEERRNASKSVGQDPTSKYPVQSK
jgi:Flp pilus assembly protein TadB